MLGLQILVLLGLVDAIYIWHKRTSGATAVCPLKQDCRKLYNLPQARFFSIHWDIWGIAYYAGMLVLTTIPAAFSLLQIGAVIGVLVSIYLLYIQHKIKNYCTWCLISELITALMAILIFKL